MKFTVSILLAALCVGTWAAPAPKADALAEAHGSVEDYVIYVDKAKRDAAIEDYVIYVDKAKRDASIEANDKVKRDASVEEYVIYVDKAKRE